MSLESKIEALTAAVIALTAKIEGINVTAAAPVAPAPAPVVQAAPVCPSLPPWPLHQRCQRLPHSLPLPPWPHLHPLAHRSLTARV